MSTAKFADFVQAQNPIYSQVVSELTQGRKRSHWMWFIFPQIQGLGFSAMAQRYALDSLEQAQDYLQHEILGPRLLQCAELLLPHTDKTSLEIFGRPDNLKLQSSLTLFALAAKEYKVFEQLLQQFYAGEYDQQTLHILGR